MKRLQQSFNSFHFVSANRFWKCAFLFLVLLLVFFQPVNAQIARRGATTTAIKSVAAGTTMTLTKPTGVVSGDLLIMAYAGNNYSSQPALAGWTVIPMNFGRPSILYKVAGASEPVNYTFTVDAVTAAAGMFAFSGVDVSGDSPFEAIGCNVRWTNWDQLSTCGINTQYEGAAVLMFTSASASTAFSGWSTTSPGALTEILQAGTTGAAIGAAWALKPTIGNTGDGHVILTPATAVSYPILLALKRKPVIARRGATTTAIKSVATGTTITLNKPTGVIAGDLLMMAYAGNNYSSQPALAGWTVLPMNFGRPSILYKVAGASEPTSYTFTVDAVTAAAGMFAFSDVDVSGESPFEAIGCNVRWTNWDQLSTCGINTQYEGAAVLMFTSASVSTAFSNWSTTSPGVLTEILQAGTTGAGIGAAWANKPTIGNTGNGNVLLTPYAPVAYPILLALKRRQSCKSPEIPTLGTTSSTNCGPQSTTLSITTGALNSATSWKWYTGSCGGVNVGTGTSITVTPSATTTYYVRGEGSCVTPGSCASITITVNNLNTYYVDADGDGFGGTTVAMLCSPTAPQGYSLNNTDCNDNNGTIWRTATLYVDADGDSYTIGNGTAICYGASIPAGYRAAPNGTDCDDTNAAIHAPVLYYIDADGDGFGGTNTAMLCSATAPAGYSTNNTDCDDTNVNTWQSATLYVDADGDGFTIGIGTIVCYGATIPVGYSATANGNDCDDTNISIWQSATLYVDADGDGFTIGNGASVCYGAAIPVGYSATANGTDCDDTNAAIHGAVLYYTDADGDGFGGTTTAMLCSTTAPEGYSTNNTDCDDTNVNTWQSATLYVDADGDGYTIGNGISICYGAAIPAGYRAATNGNDCDDTNINMWQSATLYVDADADGYTIGNGTNVCYGASIPSGYSSTANGNDCDDTNVNIWQSATLYVDADGDGYTIGNGVSVCYGTEIPAGYSSTANGTDCDDTNAAIHASVLYYSDGDGDGYGGITTGMFCSATAPEGYSTNNTDCNDNNASVYPGATEIPDDGIDQDCNGSDLVTICTTPTITPGGPVTICLGTTVTLTSSAITGNQWYLNGVIIEGATASIYNASAGGAYTVQTGTCVSDPVTITAIDKPVINETINVPGSTCAGENVTFSISALNAVSFTWSVPSGWGIQSGQGTGSILVKVGKSGGILSVFATNTCGNSDVRSLAVTSNTAPKTANNSSISGNIAVCPGTIETYTVNNIPGAVSFQWTLPAHWSFVGPSTGASVDVQTGTSGGKISVVGVNDCGKSKAISLNVKIECATATASASRGIDQEMEKPGLSILEIRAYPNPTSSAFNLFINTDERAGGVTLTITDLYGRIIERRNNIAPGAVRLGTGYIAGIYLVEVIQGNQRKLIKLVKY